MEDLDPALAHERHEGVVLLLRPVDPDDVVEQQLLGVAGRQPRCSRPGRWTMHLPQPADLRVDPVCHVVTSDPSQPPSQVATATNMLTRTNRMPM